MSDSFDRSEVEDAYHNFVAVGDSGDWNAWADLHTQDGIWLEHAFGEIRGREAIRKTITRVMEPVPMMVFPVAWHAIDGDRVVYYPWQVFPDPAGGDRVYRFGCVTVRSQRVAPLRSSFRTVGPSAHARRLAA